MKFIWILFAIFIALKILHVFKIFIFDFKNVHPILDFLTRRGKFISYFYDFYLFFYAIFPRNLKKTRRADWAEPSRRPAPSPLSSPRTTPPSPCPWRTRAAPPPHLAPSPKLLPPLPIYTPPLSLLSCYFSMKYFGREKIIKTKMILVSIFERTQI